MRAFLWNIANYSVDFMAVAVTIDNLFTISRYTLPSCPDGFFHNCHESSMVNLVQFARKTAKSPPHLQNVGCKSAYCMI